MKRLLFTALIVLFSTHSFADERKVEAIVLIVVYKCYDIGFTLIQEKVKEAFGPHPEATVIVKKMISAALADAEVSAMTKYNVRNDEIISTKKSTEAAVIEDWKINFPEKPGQERRSFVASYLPPILNKGFDRCASYIPQKISQFLRKVTN